MEKKLNTFTNREWNLRATVWATEQGYEVRVEPVKPTPYFVFKEPRQFSLRASAEQVAATIAGLPN
jgi:hypothetical protein